MKLYIGNMSKQVTEEDINNLFSAYGNIISATVIKDRETQESKGFGFVEFSDNTEALKAMKELNTREIKGREIVVNEAKPKTENRTSGGSRFNSGKRW